MHGIILKTLRDFVVDTYDEERWLEIQREADVDEKVYVPVTVYPDGDVYELVRAAGSLTGESPRTILSEYGRWVVPALLETYDLHIDEVGRPRTAREYPAISHVVADARSHRVDDTACQNRVAGREPGSNHVRFGSTAV